MPRLWQEAYADYFRAGKSYPEGAGDEGVGNPLQEGRGAPEDEGGGSIGMDNINPKHYHMKGLRFKEPECILFTERMRFNLGNAFKYVWRAGAKGDAIEDLDKAIWYLDRESESNFSSSTLIEEPEELIQDCIEPFFNQLDFSECSEIDKKKEEILFQIAIMGDELAAIEGIKRLKEFIKS